MSADPSGGHSTRQELGQLVQQQNGRAGGGLSASSSTVVVGKTSSSCGNLVTDQVLLRDVAEIVSKVRELEQSVPCLLAHDNNNGAAAAQEVDGDQKKKQDMQSVVGPDCGQSQSNSTVHTMSAAATNEASAMVQAVGGTGGQQSPSERLIIKLDTNKSSGSDGGGGVVADDNRKTDTVAGRQTSSTSGVGGGGAIDDDVVAENNAPVCSAMPEDDIKALVKELKRKIEYTERMNWLCKYSFYIKRYHGYVYIVTELQLQSIT